MHSLSNLYLNAYTSTKKKKQVRSFILCSHQTSAWLFDDKLASLRFSETADKLEVLPKTVSRVSEELKIGISSGGFFFTLHMCFGEPVPSLASNCWCAKTSHIPQPNSLTSQFPWSDIYNILLTCICIVLAHNRLNGYLHGWASTQVFLMKLR